MPAYAATPPAFARRRASPGALALIIGGHAAAIALVMTSKMDIPIFTRTPPIVVTTIPVPNDPPPQVEPEPTTDPRPSQSVIDKTPVIVPLPPLPGPTIDQTPVPIPNPGPLAGPSVEPQPVPRILPPVRHGPRLATPTDLLRPPYPPSKLRDEEEASLRLRLEIDARGRVTSVEPVGNADPVFLAAARRHLVARWRYKPATEDGTPIASTTEITLRFELEG